MRLGLLCGPAAVAVLAVPVLNGQGNSPTVEHERLAVFVGSWTLNDLEPGTTFRQDCDWFTGRFHGQG